MTTRNRDSVVCLIAAVLLFALSPRAASAEETVNAKTVAEHMDKGKYSASEIKSYLKDLKGKTVTANGKVNDIKTGRTGTRVVVFVDTEKSKDFVVDVYVDDAGELHKNDRVSCRGEYAKYNIFTVNGITLKSGKCSKK